MTWFDLPDIMTDKGDDKKDRQQIKEYLYQLTEQLKYRLNNLDTDNLSSELSEMINSASVATQNISMQATTDRTSINTLRSRVSAVESSVEAMNGTIAENQGRLTAIEQRLSSIDETILDLQQRVTALEG